MAIEDYIDKADLYFDKFEGRQVGDPCPDCGEGRLKSSKKGNLYCDKICWKRDR